MLREIRPSSPAIEIPLSVILLGAGTSRRMNGIEKIFAKLDGQPVLAYSLEVFTSFPSVNQIILVLSEDLENQARRLLKSRGWNGIVTICVGGQRRQDSVMCGLDALTPCDWVVVHDGARPLINHQILQQGIGVVRETGSAVCGVPAKDTIKLVDSEGMIIESPPREHLWQVQTPQFFRYDLLYKAHRNATGTFTDDAMMVEALGGRVKMFHGSYNNIKITTPEDLIMAEALLHQMPPLG
ncbi:2-C-methyl-D-erythritol 4-phosphate cytidylyltransferase [SAR202 cluster bacterium AD-804-J14_MRT_500m]|nr:2-C-methyl-D-erythritol 4-phosphate cytidylyltransferase [SAR202 cluster bacterium AD-804-J14_MRT_500m]